MTGCDTDTEWLVPDNIENREAERIRKGLVDPLPLSSRIFFKGMRFDRAEKSSYRIEFNLDLFRISVPDPPLVPVHRSRLRPFASFQDNLKCKDIILPCSH